MPLSPTSFLYEHDTETSLATITLNRPERLNALTFEVYAELRDTFRALSTEPGVRAVVITSASGVHGEPEFPRVIRGFQGKARTGVRLSDA